MDDARFRTQIASQLRGALSMLRKAVELCPDAVWLDPQPRNAFWRVAYHAAFYTHLYVHASEAEFTPWTKHQPGARLLGAPEPGAGPIPEPTPYARAEVLEYIGICMEQMGPRVQDLDFDATSEFWWLGMTNFEVLLYNLRHVQHHTGQLTERLRAVADVGVPWIANS